MISAFDRGNWWAIADARIAVRLPPLALSDTLAKLRTDAYLQTISVFRGTRGLELVGEPTVSDVTFRNELPAIEAQSPELPLIYLAHPFEGKEENLLRVSQIVAALNARFEAVFWSPWVPLCWNWQNSGEQLTRGLRICFAAIAKSDGFLGCNLHESENGRREHQYAIDIGVPVATFEVGARWPDELDASLASLLEKSFGVLPV